MNNELKTMLEAVMKEALQPIHEELRGLNNRVGGLEDRIGGMENELQDVKSQMNSRLDTFEQNTKNNFSDVKASIDKLSEKISVQHIENINSDTILLSEIRSIRGDVVFVNRKVADTELELNFIRQNIKQ